jgi:hypothetical protein
MYCSRFVLLFSVTPGVGGVGEDIDLFNVFKNIYLQVQYKYHLHVKGTVAFKYFYLSLAVLQYEYAT